MGTHLYCWGHGFIHTNVGGVGGYGRTENSTSQNSGLWVCVNKKIKKKKKKKKKKKLSISENILKKLEKKKSSIKKLMIILKVSD